MMRGMMRILTATCLAATFAVGLAAQSTGTSVTAGTAGTGTAVQDPQAGGGQGRGGGPRTVTGCLRAGETAGAYQLTDVQGLGGGRGAGGGATAGGGTATGTATGTGATATGQGTP